MAPSKYTSLAAFVSASSLALMGCAAVVLVAGICGWLQPRTPLAAGPPPAGAPRPGIRGVASYEELGNGTTFHLRAPSIEPAPGRLGMFASWLRPIWVAKEACARIDHRTGEQIVVRGGRCRLTNKGRKLVFENGARWARVDLDKVYRCRAITIDLDSHHVSFRGPVFEQGSAARLRWAPFQLPDFFSVFPVPQMEGQRTTKTPFGDHIASRS